MSRFGLILDQSEGFLDLLLNRYLSILFGSTIVEINYEISEIFEFGIGEAMS